MSLRDVAHFFHVEYTEDADYKNMTWEYKLVAVRVLVINKRGDDYSITLFEMTSEFRSPPFPLRRWSPFSRALSKIDNAVSELCTNAQLKYVYDTRGEFYISETPVFLCTDIRGWHLANFSE